VTVTLPLMCTYYTVVSASLSVTAW